MATLAAGAMEGKNRRNREELENEVLRRSLEVVVAAVRAANAETLGRAVEAGPSLLALTRVLSAPEVFAGLEQKTRVTPFQESLLRGLGIKKELLQRGGGTFSPAQVARILGISRQAVNARRKAGKLIGLDLGRRGYEYPAWQFGSEGTINGLEEVLIALHEFAPWTQLSFMLNPNLRLSGLTPLDALREGKIEAVVAAAELYGEQGAA